MKQLRFSHNILHSFVTLLLFCLVVNSASAQATKDGDDLVWFIQLSDLHISKYHPERAADLKNKVAAALSLIQPSLVLVTGDLTESRTATRYPTRQDDWEWYEYNTVIASLSKASGVPFETIVDIRGNHDTFGVGLRGGPGDFYPKYGAIGGRANRTAGALQRVFTVDIQAGNGPKHVLVGIDAAQEVGLRGPCNFFGMPSDALLDSLDSTLERVNRAASGRPPTVLAFGHFPLSFMARSESGRRVEDVLKKHGVDAYLCGHLHARFGGLLHKFHQNSGFVADVAQDDGADWIAGLDSEEEFEDAENLRRKLLGRETLSEKGHVSDGFWEWEMGDWKESRFMRLVALRGGQLSFTDVQFSTQEAEESGHEATAEYRRSVGLGRLVENEGTTHDSQVYDKDSALILVLSPSNGHYRESVGVDAIEALVFSRHEPLDVCAQIWDRGAGFTSRGSIKEEVKLDQVPGRERAILYSRTWDSTPYTGGQAGRYWIQIVVRDATGQKLASRQQPFVIVERTGSGARGLGRTGGRVPLFKQSVTSMLLIGMRWDELYTPALVGVHVLLLGLILLLPRFWASYLQSVRKYDEWRLRVTSRPGRAGWNPLALLSRLLGWAFWALCQSASRTSVWLPQVVYVSYLAVGPWFWGQALDDASAPLSTFYLRHWNVSLGQNRDSVAVPMPCTLILALPFYLLVLFPWMLWIAAFSAFRDLARRPALKASLSIPPRRDIEHQLGPRSTSESNLLSRTESASNLAQRRRAPSKANLKDRGEEEQVLTQSTDLRTGPRGTATLGWAIKAAGFALVCWTLLHSTFAVKSYGGSVVVSPYLLGLLCVVVSALFSLR